MIEDDTSDSNDERSPRFRSSAETQAITKLLSGLEVGTIATYEAILRAAGHNPEGSIDAVRQYIYSAEHRLEREWNMQFACVTSVGYKRIADKEMILKSRAKTDSSRRMLRRASKVTACINPENLSPTERKETLMLQAVQGASMLTLSLKASHQIAKKLEENLRLQVGDDVLKLFREQQ